jgi:hypothetical protein
MITGSRATPHVFPVEARDALMLKASAGGGFTGLADTRTRARGHNQAALHLRAGQRAASNEMLMSEPARPIVGTAKT